MDSISVKLLTFFSSFFTFLSSTQSSTIIEDLNRPIPPDFQDTIARNCIKNPSLRYCNLSPPDLPNVFKSTIVANHLCYESKNPNCTDSSFTKIDLTSRPLIAPLYLSFTFFWKYCPLTISTIHLSNNSLKGPFPSEILHCSQIHSLDLRHNDLVGELPVEALLHLNNLTFLNLSYNRFSSETNLTQLLQRFNSSSFIHSGLFPFEHSHILKLRGVIFLLGSLIFFVSMMGCFGWLCFRRPDLLPPVLQRRNRFTLATLKAATKGFLKEETLVAKSGSVEIYRGVLRDGTQVGIELERGKIPIESRKEFIRECKTLVELQHKNLIRVLGWCDRRELRAIVTKWVEVDSVKRWLSGSPPWKQRMKVLMGVVEGMCYLQENWPHVGYDLRTTTVLLSANLNPLISRFHIGDQNNNPRRIYKLGVFLLEMVSNKRPREEFERGETGFIEWVRLHYPVHVRKVMDERLKKTNIAYEAVKRVTGIGLMCTDLTTNRQLSLTQISQMLSRVYMSFMVSTSPTHQRAKSERSHKRNQSR